MSNSGIFAQKAWFRFYTDSFFITKDADYIADLFNKDIKAVFPKLEYQFMTKLKTKPLHVYYQFVEIYENESLPSFEEFIKNYGTKN